MQNYLIRMAEKKEMVVVRANSYFEAMLIMQENIIPLDEEEKNPREIH